MSRLPPNFMLCFKLINLNGWTHAIMGRKVCCTMIIGKHLSIFCHVSDAICLTILLNPADHLSDAIFFCRNKIQMKQLEVSSQGIDGSWRAIEEKWFDLFQTKETRCERQGCFDTGFEKLSHLHQFPTVVIQFDFSRTPNPVTEGGKRSHVDANIQSECVYRAMRAFHKLDADR